MKTTALAAILLLSIQDPSDLLARLEDPATCAAAADEVLKMRRDLLDRLEKIASDPVLRKKSPGTAARALRLLGELYAFEKADALAAVLDFNDKPKPAGGSVPEFLQWARTCPAVVAMSRLGPSTLSAVFDRIASTQTSDDYRLVASAAALQMDPDAEIRAANYSAGLKGQSARDRLRSFVEVLHMAAGQKR